MSYSKVSKLLLASLLISKLSSSLYIIIRDISYIRTRNKDKNPAILSKFLEYRPDN